MHLAFFLGFMRGLFKNYYLWGLISIVVCLSVRRMLAFGLGPPQSFLSLCTSLCRVVQISKNNIAKQTQRRRGCNVDLSPNSEIWTILHYALVCDPSRSRVHLVLLQEFVHVSPSRVHLRPTPPPHRGSPSARVMRAFFFFLFSTREICRNNYSYSSDIYSSPPFFLF